MAEPSRTERPKATSSRWLVGAYGSPSDASVRLRSNLALVLGKVAYLPNLNRECEGERRMRS